MNRIKCSSWESKSIIPPAAKEVFKNNNKNISKEDKTFNTEHQDSVSDKKIIKNSSGDLGEPLFWVMNPKTKTNHYKCTNLDKYLSEGKKTTQQEQTTAMDRMDKKAETFNLVEDDIDSKDKESQIIEHHQHELSGSINCTDEESIDNMVIGFEEKQSKEEESVESDSVAELDQQDCNFSIKASPIVFDLLKHVKITGSQDKEATENVNMDINISGQQTKVDSSAVETINLSNITKALLKDIIGNAASNPSVSLLDFITIKKADDENE